MGTVDFDRGSEPLADALRGGLAWTRASIDPSACVFALSDAHHREIDGLLSAMAGDRCERLARRAADHHLPRLEALMADVRRALTDGPGVAVVDRLDIDRMGRESAVDVYWLLCQMVAMPVAQSHAGAMLYDVLDSGRRYQYGVRSSVTNVEIVFHNDNAFGRSVPDYVGLLCLETALTGGVSRFCSMYAVHEELRRHAPDALARLYQPFLWDRQAEHASGEALTARASVFRAEHGRLAIRANASLIRKGYEVAGEVMDPEAEQALAVFSSVAEDPRFWFELPIGRGQLQFINNRETAHYRSAFTDHPEPARRRHLVRAWMRREGQPHYDG